VFVPDNINVPFPALITPAGFALNAFVIDDVIAKLAPDKPEVVIVRFSPFKSNETPLTVGTVA
jgi:hypothetical protein